MKIIISPAKKMNIDLDCPAVPETARFLSEAREIQAVLQQMDYAQLKSLWKCSDKLAEQNFSRIQELDFSRATTPAVFAYEGIQYRYMAPNIMEQSQLDYLQEHLCILSGFYGILRPFDGVVPYRLEMQAKLAVGEAENLYQFWGDKLAKTLDCDCVINLASAEYSKAIEKHLPASTKFITCVFGEDTGEKIVEKGTMCKMARGRMVQWLAENNIEDIAQICAFNQLDFAYSEANSSDNKRVFLKQKI